MEYEKEWFHLIGKSQALNSPIVYRKTDMVFLQQLITQNIWLRLICLTFIKLFCSFTRMCLYKHSTSKTHDLQNHRSLGNNLFY